ncbi:MAG: protein-L-isoaspartate(D-aspartate) O-methyltransferase [Xanthomonadales bacterium]|nr:Protein-L-isoaspartate O-methyltransferase [Xanthomonadales bacterium]MCC6594741.1 protein-L-isoaspartate(D-aspartate) O-methyltransferase [Xanthomonadales bacterium]MCE7932458.1 protein-L-isoaspartate(D-aspartate) O-methyltransferase [Xanthomonadales bacterium PRO6]
MTRFQAPRPTDSLGTGMTSQRARDRLLERLKAQGIVDARVLEVIGRVPRHLFVDEALASRAYEDTALPIGLGQTISQPYVVALMTQALLRDGAPDKVLEIGTGSGYQAAVLSLLCREVHTVERIDELLRQARKRFRRLGYRNIRSKHDDGNIGWREHAPFDALIVTAAREALEPALLEQVAPGGIAVAPLGPVGQQTLVRMQRGTDGWSRENLGAVSFVPLVRGVL